MGKTLVIIPVFNEENTIGDVIDLIRSNHPHADILVINDGSTDNSSGIALEKGVFIINLPYNLGIGGAMQTGFKFAKIKDYDIAIQVDADGQHDPQFIDKLIEPLENNQVDMVIGSRFYKRSNYKSAVARRLGTKIFAFILSNIVHHAISDPTSGFRSTNKKLINIFAESYPEDYPEVEAVLLLHKKGCSFKEMPVLMSQRKAGSSSITPLKSIYYMLKVTLSIFISLLRK